MFEYMIIPVDDDPSVNILKYFEDAVSFIDKARKRGAVLVHWYTFL